MQNLVKLIFVKSILQTRAEMPLLPRVRGAAVAEEQIDVVTPLGEFTGVTRDKSAVHANGDWHMCVHIIITNGQGYVVEQFRGPDVKLMRNVWDAMSIAGHISAVTRKEANPWRPDIIIQAIRAGIREGWEEVRYRILEEWFFTPKCRFIGVSVTNMQTEDGWMDRTLTLNFVLVAPDFNIGNRRLERGKVLEVRWRHVDDIERALDGQTADKYANRQPDQQWMMRMMIAAVRLIAQGY
jgi:hypothetical protein